MLEQPVGELELEQVSLFGLLRQELVVERLIAIESGLRVGAALVGLARWQEAQRLVGEEHVHEPQRRLVPSRGRAYLRERRLEALLAAAVQQVQQPRALHLADGARAELRPLLVGPDLVAPAQQREEVGR